MKKIKLVIGEEEERYAEKLASYIRKKEDNGIQAVWYADKEELLCHESKKEPEIYLLGSEFWQEECLSQIRKSQNQRLLVLLSEDTADRRLIQYPFISKYQTAEEIVRQIYQIASQYLEDDTVWRGSKKRIIGVCAPWNYELSMLFSLTLAQVLGAEQKVLYVTCQECYGIKQKEEVYSGKNIIDAVSTLRKHPQNPGALLRSIIKETGMADYFPPADNPQNLYELTQEDYRMMLGTIEEQLDYDLILWEAGILNHEMAGWMEQCQIIYCPYQEELFVDQRKRQLEHILSLYNVAELFHKLQFIKLPKVAFPADTDDFFEQMQWGGLASFIREQVIKHGV